MTAPRLLYIHRNAVQMVVSVMHALVISDQVSEWVPQSVTVSTFGECIYSLEC